MKGLAAWGLVLLVALVTAIAHAEVPSGGGRTRLALVIGNDSYQSVTGLKNARADATAIGRALKGAGFQVTLQLDANEKTMKEALRSFKMRLSGGDEAVFYFSGHGVQLGAANYLLPTDISGDNEEQVKDDALSLQRVLDDLQEQKVSFSLAIVDACRNNPFKGKGRAIGGRGLAPTTAATGQMVIYSAGVGQEALDRLSKNDPDPNGLFTRIFLKEMDKPGVPVHLVVRSVREEVVRLAKSVGHEQVPALYDQVVGDFFLKPGDGTPVSAGPRPGTILKDCAECPEMVVIPAGSFNMGSPSDEAGRHDDEGPQHRVGVSTFALAKTHVTRGQFAAFVKETGYQADGSCYERLVRRWYPEVRNWKDPGYPQQDSHPVVCVNWNDAKAYTKWLSRKTGKRYRLPTEAEWEYAARAGTTTARYWGESADQACGYANVLDQTAKTQKIQRDTSLWLFDNCTDGYAYTAPVASFKANAFGLYDMIGNAWEWVEDCHHDNYNGAPTDGSAWTGGECRSRVTRGGSWNFELKYARSAVRIDNPPEHRNHSSGFRPARMLP